MIINTATISSLYDMYKQNSITPFNEEGQIMITNQMWNKYWHIQSKTLNYLNNTEEEPFWKNLTLACLDLMDHVGSYMTGEFDTYNDEHIQEIWPIIIKGWYFGKIWIIKSEEIRDLEIALAESEIYKNMIPENKLYRNNPFRIFEMQGNQLFKSLLTGIPDFKLNPQEMIYLSLNEGINFRKWWKINMEYISGKSRIIDALKAMNKTVQVIVRNQENYKIERQQIENPSVFYELHRQTGTIGETEQNLYQHMPIIDGQRIKDMQNIIQSIYEKECELLGFTFNSNQKKERLTSAENYKDLKRITNIQDFQLKSLINFSNKLKTKKWVKENFEIKISGLTYAEGIPNTIKTSHKDTKTKEKLIKTEKDITTENNTNNE